jgi:hypothetical protein
LSPVKTDWPAVQTHLDLLSTAFNASWALQKTHHKLGQVDIPGTQLECVCFGPIKDPRHFAQSIIRAHLKKLDENVSCSRKLFTGYLRCQLL